MGECYFKKREVHPHKCDYWLNPKIGELKSFLLRVHMICYLYVEALFLKESCNTYIICVDEKTGIQALSRIAPDLPPVPGKTRKKEFGYVRNGTTTLLAARSVHDGKVIHHQFSDTHKEHDFVSFVQQCVRKLPQDAKIILIADQFSTHLSESVVKWVSEQIGEKQDLGIKWKKGILKSKISRRLYLEKPDHRIQFFYTPPHCSWLNQIENWFGQLSRQTLRNADFQSVKELKNRIENYIQYFNHLLAHPMKWTKNMKILSKLNS